MKNRKAYLRAAWMVPVPVEPGGFRAAQPEHADLDIVAATHRIGPFGIPSNRIDPETLLYADLQTNLDGAFQGRLGAGRAGYYRGHYIKGVGRTPLAANWNLPDSHSTGHLPASVANRELVVSEYVRARGERARLSACDGILLRPNADVLGGFYRRDGGAGTDHPQPCDRFQALTVKDGNFARWSNFMWQWNHLIYRSGDHGNGLPSVLDLLAYYARPADPLPEHELTPERLATVIVEAVERGVANFGRYWEIGVGWIFVQNNVTLDGRMHDLDVHYALGGPFVGIMQRHAPTTVRLPAEFGQRVFGLEVLDHLSHVAVTMRGLLDRMRFVGEATLGAHPDERSFVVDLRRALSARLADAACFSPARVRERLIRRFTDGLDLSRTQAKAVGRIVTQSVRLILERKPIDVLELKVEPVAITMCRNGLGLRPFAIEGIHPSAEQCALANAVNAQVESLDGMTDLDELLIATTQVRRAFQRAVRQCVSERRTKT